jgi:hypothetical protein
VGESVNSERLMEANGMRFLPTEWGFDSILYRPLPRLYRERFDQKAGWQELFSDEEMSRVDALLRPFCDAFGFSGDERYRFAPTDTIAEVYRACYPRWHFWSIGDNMEIESLMSLKRCIATTTTCAGYFWTR